MSLSGAIICIFYFIINFLLLPTLLATRMTGTSSEARTLAIRLRYSTASLKLCLQKEKEKALPLVAEDNGHNSDNRKRIVPVSDAVADYESLATAHVLLAHCCELNLRGNSLEIDSQKS